MGRKKWKMRGLRNLPSSIAIDTGPLLLPITRERGWNKVRELLEMHERGEITIYVGLFNICELAYAMYRLGFDMELALKYARLVYEKLEIVKDIRYTTWMSTLRVGAYEHKYNIPWGDISSAAVALTLNIPVIVLDEDKHFDHIALVSNKLGRTLQAIHIIKDLRI